jgi:hypothetical protein
MNPDKYLFRRQFILGPKFISGLNGWHYEKISDKVLLSVHPELELTQINNKNKKIVMMGYILDPYHPKHSNAQILEGILESVQSVDDLFRKISTKCGRYVIMAKFEDDFLIFSDSCGQRQIFYGIDSLGNIWCASQPTFIAEKLNITIDEEKRNDLQRTVLFSKNPSYWYPDNLTLFKGIYHLRPNHYIDLINYTCVRYWPRNVLIPIDRSECVEKVSIILRGIIESATVRFDNIAFALSSGLDSRMLLAASKGHGSKIRFFTHVPKGEIDYSNPDVKIPSSLLNKLGLRHSLIAHPDSMDAEFETILRKNVFTARNITGLNAYSIHKHFHGEDNNLVVIYGNASEITKRDRYRWPNIPQCMITGQALTEMAQMTGSKHALDVLSTWLISVKHVQAYGVNVLDLMHWEQRVGSWLAMALSEYDIAFESLCPYSCLEYIEYMLRVPFKYRTMPDYKLHYEVINNLWPETLEMEINPPKNKMRKAMMNLLYRTNFYDLFKYVYIMTYRRYA